MVLHRFLSELLHEPGELPVGAVVTIPEFDSDAVIGTYVADASHGADRVAAEREADLDHISGAKGAIFAGADETSGDAQVNHFSRHTSLGDHVVKSDVGMTGKPPVPALLTAGD